LTSSEAARLVILETNFATSAGVESLSSSLARFPSTFPVSDFAVLVHLASKFWELIEFRTVGRAEVWIWASGVEVRRLVNVVRVVKASVFEVFDEFMMNSI
jgi:hypothetical protein